MVQEMERETDEPEEPQIHIDAERFNNAKMCIKMRGEIEFDINIPDGYYEPSDFARTFNRSVSAILDIEFDLPVRLTYIDETNQFVLTMQSIEFLVEYMSSVAVMLGFEKPERYSTDSWTSTNDPYLGISKYPPIFDLNSLMN